MKFLEGCDNFGIDGLRISGKTDRNNTVGTVICGDILASGVVSVSRRNNFFMLCKFH